MESKVVLEALNEENWLRVCKLTVSEEQKKVFPIPNVYWIGISRYEEHTELLAIKVGDEYVGLIGYGYDEDGVSGYINPVMIDARYQGHRYGEAAMRRVIELMKNQLKVSEIHLGHRKANIGAAKLYERLGFVVVGEDEQDYFRNLQV